MPTSTYTPIATNTLGSTAASVTFSSIPSTYTDLVLVIVSADSAGAFNQISFRVNGDASTIYSWTSLYGNGTSAASNRESSGSRTYGTIAWNSAQNTTLGTSMSTAHFMNYANTTTNKTILSRSSNSANAVETMVSLYASTSAMSSLVLYSATSARLFAAGSTFTLYGIKAA